MMTNAKWPALAAAVTLLAAPSVWAGQCQITTIDVPNRALTIPYGISRDGSYVAGAVSNAQGGTEGFVWDHASFVRVKAPLDGGLTFYGVNDLGRAVGTTHGSPIGVEYDARRKQTRLVFGSSVLSSVNNSGIEVGFQYGTHGTGEFGVIVYPSGSLIQVRPAGYKQARFTHVSEGVKAVGFARSVRGKPDAVFSYAARLIKEPGAPAGAVPVTTTPDGTIVGTAPTATGTEVFTLDRGTYTSLVFPGALYTAAVGVDRVSQVYGKYGATFAYADGSFVLDNGTYYALQVPGATLTTITAVSPRGQLIGTYVAGGVRHAFFAKCLPRSGPAPANPPG